MPPKNQYRVQIPQDLLDAGFPVEWLVIDQDGTVLIHYSTPVLLDNLTLDDRPVINLTSGLKMLIGTGETVELQMQLAKPFMDSLARCPNCKQSMPEEPTHPWAGECRVAPGDWPEMRCTHCYNMEAHRKRLYAAIDAGVPYQPEMTHDGYCRCCGQQRVTVRMMDEVLTKIGDKAKGETDDKTKRMLKRLERRTK